MKYSSAIKTNNILSFMTTWMESEHIPLNTPSMETQVLPDLTGV